MTDHFPLMVPGSKATSPPREVSAPYDGTLLATVDTADSGVAECMSVQRVFAHRSIAKDLADRLGQLASKLRVDDPTLPETEVGPLIRHKEVLRVDRWVKEALDGSRAWGWEGSPTHSATCRLRSCLWGPPPETP